MTDTPVICFGQQPSGFFPKRFLVAKIRTARALQREIGGQIVFFYHDSDHDPRETKTVLRHKKNNVPLSLNFTFANRLQRKYSPLYAKRVLVDWRDKTLLQLPPFVRDEWVEAFRQAPVTDVASFCLAVYRSMGLLEGIQVVHSGDPEVRRAACKIDEYFVDFKHEGEIVRGRPHQGALRLHEGGDSFIDLPSVEYGPEAISPTRDSRLVWMQSIVHCTHYVAGLGEQAYLKTAAAPGITFVPREEIDRSDEAYTDDRL